MSTPVSTSKRKRICPSYKDPCVGASNEPFNTSEQSIKQFCSEVLDKSDGRFPHDKLKWLHRDRLKYTILDISASRAKYDLSHYA